MPQILHHVPYGYDHVKNSALPNEENRIDVTPPTERCGPPRDCQEDNSNPDTVESDQKHQQALPLQSIHAYNHQRSGSTGSGLRVAAALRLSSSLKTRASTSKTAP